MLSHLQITTDARLIQHGFHTGASEDLSAPRRRDVSSDWPTLAEAGVLLHAMVVLAAAGPDGARWNPFAGTFLPPADARRTTDEILTYKIYARQLQNDNIVDI